MRWLQIINRMLTLSVGACLRMKSLSKSIGGAWMTFNSMNHLNFADCWRAAFLAVRLTMKQIALMLLVSTVVSACSPSVRSGPARLYKVDDELAALKSIYGADKIRAYSEAPTTDKEAFRNSLVLGRLYAIDLAYGKYEAQLTKERQQIPFIATVTSIALSGTGALIADATTKSILAAVDTGLKGSVEAYEKDILVQKTIDVLQIAMRANRARVRSEILTQLTLGVSQYPLELALSDIDRYYQAGTLTGGFLSVTEASAEDLSNAKINAVTSINKFGTDDDTTKIRNYLARTGNRGQENIRKWLQGKGQSVTLTALQFKQSHATLRSELVQDFGL